MVEINLTSDASTGYTYVYKNYFRKASGSNIGAQIYNTSTYINIYCTLNKTPSE
jgi:hypothetical protein